MEGVMATKREVREPPTMRKCTGGWREPISHKVIV